MRCIFGKLTILAALMMPHALCGQTLPALPKDPAVTSGRLPNGVDYFIVKNPSYPGHADFALVQKGFSDPELSRKALLSLPHLGGRVPYLFLTDHGVKCPPEGFISRRFGTTRFDFRDMDIYEKAVADTMLMMLSDMAATCKGGQAMVVSGDINPAEITEKMKMFSLLLDARGEAMEEEPDVWRQPESLCVHFSRNQTRDVAAIHLRCGSHRLPQDQMNTAMPMVTRMLAYELGIVLRDRIESAFNAARIPLGGVEYRYSDASSSPGEDKYLVSVYTSAAELAAASRLLASILSDLDSKGATIGEFKNVKAQMIFSAKRGSYGRGSGNAAYVDKCVSAYLYGTNLSPDSYMADFLLKRNLPVEKELDLFNNFAKALLNPDRNLCIRFDTPDIPVDEAAIVKGFTNSWKTAALPDIKWDMVHDDSRLLNPSSKLKISGETPEPITGGKMITFSNGMKVIYKNTPSTGTFSYGVLLKGGVSDISNLKPGENRYVADMLSLYAIGGMKGTDFRKMLSVRGVQMEFEASLSDLRIMGSAPSSEFGLVMRSLIAIANDRKVDHDAFELYARSCKVKDDMKLLKPRDVDALMDGMLFPDYRYLPGLAAGMPDSSVQTAAEMYFSKQFSKMTDGVIVLVGDLGEETVRKDLCRMLGAFNTLKRYSPRPAVTKTPASEGRSGESMSVSGIIGGLERGCSIELCVPMQFSIASYSAFSTAVDIFEKELCRVMAGCGYSTEVKSKLELFPAEQQIVYIHLRPCSPGSLPYGIEPADPEEAMEHARKVIASAGELTVTAETLKAAKTCLMTSYDGLTKSPARLTKAVLVRYGEGRNVVSDYKNAVNSVSEANVQDALKLIAAAHCADYMIR